MLEVSVYVCRWDHPSWVLSAASCAWKFINNGNIDTPQPDMCLFSVFPVRNSCVLGCEWPVTVGCLLYLKLNLCCPWYLSLTRWYSHPLPFKWYLLFKIKIGEVNLTHTTAVLGTTWSFIVVLDDKSYVSFQGMKMHTGSNLDDKKLKSHRLKH